MTLIANNRYNKTIEKVINGESPRPVVSVRNHATTWL